MRFNLAFSAFAVIALQQVVQASFLSDCQNGILDIGKEFMRHLEGNFPDVTKGTAREMSYIYSYALRLLKNEIQESQLSDLYVAIGEYLKVCNTLFNFTATLSESMVNIESNLKTMKIEDVCKRPQVKVYVFRDILQSKFVIKLLSLEYFEETFSTVVAGVAKALNAVVSSVLCLFQDCDGIINIIRSSIGDIISLTADFIGDILTDIQEGLEKLFGDRFAMHKCEVTAGFINNCSVLNAHLEDVKLKLDRQLTNYQICLDDKASTAKKIKSFTSMLILLKLRD